MHTINAATRPLSAGDLVGIFAALAHHKEFDFSRLTYVCTDCGTIGIVEDDRASRDMIVDNYDLTCCSEESTITFHSVPDDESVAV